MKPLRIIGVAVLLSMSSLFFFSASCESDPGYYISFKADGMTFTFNQGLTDITSEAFGNIVFSDTAIILFATPEQNKTSASAPNTYIIIQLFATGIGTYPPSGENFIPLAALLTVFYIKDGVSYSSNSFPGEVSLTIDTLEDVDGVIEGTFYAHVGDGILDIQITEGRFRVKRVPNESFTGFII